MARTVRSYGRDHGYVNPRGGSAQSIRSRQRSDHFGSRGGHGAGSGGCAVVIVAGAGLVGGLVEFVRVVIGA